MKKDLSTLTIVLISFVVLIGWATWRQTKGLLPETEKDNNWTHCFSTTFNYPIHCWTPNGWLSINRDRSAPLIALNNLGIDDFWSVVGKELVITGYLSGRWFFEADCLAEIHDYQGQIITKGLAVALADWMTEELVPFQASFIWPDNLNLRRAILVIVKDNPTGLMAEDEGLVIPIKLNYISQ